MFWATKKMNTYGKPSWHDICLVLSCNKGANIYSVPYFLFFYSIRSEKRMFASIRPWPMTYKLYSMSPFDQRHAVNDVWAKLTQGGKKLCSRQEISDRRTDGRIDRWTDGLIIRLQRGALIMNWNNMYR